VLGGTQTLDIPKSPTRRRGFAEPDSVSIAGKGKNSRASDAASFGKQLLEASRHLRRSYAEASPNEFPVKIEIEAGERRYTFGYSPETHRLTILEKKYKGRVFKSDVVWETDKQFEDLIAGHIGK